MKSWAPPGPQKTLFQTPCQVPAEAHVRSTRHPATPGTCLEAPHRTLPSNAGHIYTKLCSYPGENSVQRMRAHSCTLNHSPLCNPESVWLSRGRVGAQSACPGPRGLRTRPDAVQSVHMPTCRSHGAAANQGCLSSCTAERRCPGSARSSARSAARMSSDSSACPTLGRSRSACTRPGTARHRLSVDCHPPSRCFQGVGCSSMMGAVTTGQALLLARLKSACHI